MLKTLSVVIPTYRRSQKLPQLLDSFTRQTVLPDEIVIIDQNPEQTPPAWYEDYAARLPLKIRFQPEPNASAARNLGFLSSSGDLVLFVDDDLVAGERFCELAIQRFRSYPNDVHCLCASIVVEGKVCCTEMIDSRMVGPVKELVGMQTAITAAVFFERNYFRQTGGFDELLFRFARTAEDQEFFLRMRRKGMPFWMDRSLLIEHDDNVPGGCELRSDDYWKSRERCVKSWVLRHRIHGQRAGRLSPADLFQLMRSAVLNRRVLQAGPKTIFRNTMLLTRALKETWMTIQPALHKYSCLKSIDHLGNRISEDQRT
jgi:glycosyltransferase involved in cell wall biosynthesis